MNTLLLKITAKDGVDIQAEFVRDEAQPIKGVVVVVHGFGEHMGNYRVLASVFAKSGYASLLFDQRGHGDFSAYKNPEKLKGIIPSYQSFLDDIDIVIAEAKRLVPDVPLILYGHSMGGNIAFNYLLRHGQSDFSCAVFESPWFGLYHEFGSIVICLGRFLGWLSPKIAIYNKLDPDSITGDADVAGTYGEDQLYHNRMSFRMFIGVHDACAYALANASKLSIPIYLARGVNDKIVSNDAIAKVGETIGRNVTAKEYDSHHAIRNDLVREEFCSDVVEYLDARIYVS
jgi:alpha-beta hydrolase superfamily lysophospholipase